MTERVNADYRLFANRRVEDVRMGEIGPVRREITFEPLPEDEPIEVPAEPVPVPA